MLEHRTRFAAGFVTRTFPWLTIGAALLATAPLQAQRRSSLITVEEIERLGPSVGTAYDVVRTLRPQWLRVRRDIMSGRRPEDQVGVAPVHVYLDDREAGDLEYLRTIPAERVFELRWLSATEAGVRYGPTAGPGIVVTLRS
jgi:hypothetical protein